jgi:hypothetical protein
MEKIKEIISVDTRISLFQTAMNNAGRNFTGKKVKVAAMAKFATEFYKLAINEISEIGKMELEQLAKIAASKNGKRTKKQTSKTDISKLINKAKKVNGKK